MKAIETRYHGLRFRSRLEARWAVFLDTLSIPYRYEAEGYNLGDGILYLPDFWLPDQECFFEVKGQLPTGDDEVKAHRLSGSSRHPVYIFHGEIPAPEDLADEEHEGAIVYEHGYESNSYQFWAECPDCGILGITNSGYSNMLVHRCLTCANCESHRIWKWWKNAAEYEDVGVAWDVAGWVRGFKQPDFCPLSDQECHGCPKRAYSYDNRNRVSARLTAAYLAARGARFEHGEGA